MTSIPMRVASIATVTVVAALAAGCGGSSARPVAAPTVEPLSAAAYRNYLRGRIAFYEGDYRESIRRFRAASNAAPDQAPVRVALIDALVRAGRHGEARRVAEQAQERWPRESAVWLASGAIYRRAGMLEPAMRAYGKAREFDADNEGAYLGLAAVYIALGLPDRAERTYRDLIARDPDSVPGRFELARRLIDRGALTVAQRHLRLVIERDPEHVKARVALARTLRVQGKKAEAVDTLRRAFERSDGDPRVGELLFRRLLDAGDRQQALALLAVLDRDDLPRETRLSFGELYLRLGDPDSALAVARAVRASHPASGAARLLEATALVQRSRGRRAGSGELAGRELARQLAAMLVEVAPGDERYARCRAFAGEILAQVGDDAQAVAILEEAARARPDDLGLIIARARVEELGGRVAEARAIFRAALVDRPESVRLRFRLAMLEDRQGRAERAVTLMESILRARPDHWAALNFIGFSLADRNVDLRRAQQLLERALELSPGNGHILDSYGWLLFRQKRLDRAVEVLERAVSLAPSEPEILWHLGEVYLARQDRARALEVFERAHALGPEPPIARRLQARLRALRAAAPSRRAIGGGPPTEPE